jgi:hypothetical protein
MNARFLPPSVSHHCRTARAALAAARAVVRALPGTGDGVAAWIGVSPLGAG